MLLAMRIVMVMVTLKHVEKEMMITEMEKVI